MDISCLSVELVETLQKMVEQGKSISKIIAKLQSATLPGLLEYGCIRYNMPEIFPLVPECIYTSSLGIALREIRSELGLRFDGQQKPFTKNIDSRKSEFSLIPIKGNIDEDVGWQTYLGRFERSAIEAGFSEKSAIKLQSAFYEMSENALLHSQSRINAVAGYATSNGTAVFSIADVGIGVKESLKCNQQYSDLSEDVDAIQLALQTGVTCKGNNSGGFGFNSVFKALAEQWGQLRFRSGNGCITMDGRDIKSDKTRRHRLQPIPGFQVSVCCQVNSPILPDSLF